MLTPREDIQISKPHINTAEQPSPISVLNSMLYGDESPPPMKVASNAFEGKPKLDKIFAILLNCSNMTPIAGTAELNSHESQWDQENLKSSFIRTKTQFQLRDQSYWIISYAASSA